MGNNLDNYISLQEATKYCPHSQEYLSLRARQGKLKAVKFGRNWVTKKEWLEEYLEKVEKYNNNLNAKNVVARGPLKAGGRREGWSPPGNLPIERPVPLVRFGFVTALVFVLLVAGCVFGKESFKNVYQELNPIVIEFNENFDFHLTTLVSEFNENFDKGVVGLAKDISSYTYIVGTYIVGGAGDIIVENTIEILADTISDIPQSFVTVSGDVSQFSEGIAAISLPEISLPEISIPEISVKEWFSSQTKEVALGISTITEIFSESYFAANDFIKKSITQDIDNLVRGILAIKEQFSESWQRIVSRTIQNYLVANDFVERKINQGYKVVTQLWRTSEKIVEEKLIPKPGEEGIVLIPSTEKDEEVKEKIKEAFSDEVKVEPKDKTSGIITPIFKEGEGEKYLYILVPIQNEN